MTIALLIGTIGTVSVLKAVNIDRLEFKCACLGRDPMQRDRAHVAEDIHNGINSAERARAHLNRLHLSARRNSH